MSGAWTIVQEFSEAECPHCRGTGEVYGYDGSLGDCYHRSVVWVDHDDLEPLPNAQNQPTAPQTDEKDTEPVGRPVGRHSGEGGGSAMTCTHAHRFPDHWLAWRARKPGEQIRYCPACRCWVTEPVNDLAAVVFSVSDTREAA